jgi:hypothetical protein
LFFAIGDFGRRGVVRTDADSNATAGGNAAGVNGLAGSGIGIDASVEANVGGGDDIHTGAGILFVLESCGDLHGFLGANRVALLVDEGEIVERHVDRFILFRVDGNQHNQTAMIDGRGEGKRGLFFCEEFGPQAETVFFGMAAISCGGGAGSDLGWRSGRFVVGGRFILRKEGSGEKKKTEKNERFAEHKHLVAVCSIRRMEAAWSYGNCCGVPDLRIGSAVSRTKVEIGVEEGG